MDIGLIARTRHTCKAYNPELKLPEAHVDQLKTLLRYAPSSVNAQPWHFFLAASASAKARIATAAHGPYAANQAKIQRASHVVVLCVRTDLDDDYLAACKRR